MIDNDLDTVYEGTVKAEERTEDAQAVISLGRTEAIAGVKYTYKGTGEPIRAYSISISEDGTDWKEIKRNLPAGKWRCSRYILTRKMTEGTISMMQPM